MLGLLGNHMKKPLQLFTAGALALTSLLAAPIAVRAADHADGPTVANDQGADLADVYAFLDPNDNSKTVLITTFRGFIVPGEAVNFTIFDPTVRYRIEIENTGDAVPDKHIDITFAPKKFGTSTPGDPQDVFFQITGMRKPLKAGTTTPANLNATAPAPVLNPPLTVPGGTVELFAGEVDDPFFFDIPAFSRFVKAYTVDKVTDVPTLQAILSRGRDTFAGYNVLAVALRVPTTLLKSAKAGAPTKIGVSVLAQRHNVEMPTAAGTKKGIGAFRTVDREGIPGVNAILLPASLRNAYNASHPSLDGRPKNKVFKDAILATLGEGALETNTAGQTLLGNLAIATGDYLRLETNPAEKPNSGPDGGTFAGSGFPNGRRLADDVIDVVISVVRNGTITGGDNVNGNVVTTGNGILLEGGFRDEFPYLAPPNQPRDPGVDDDTRN
jgi:hypothetical protein